MSEPLVESHRCRRIIGRLSAGEELLQSLLEVCRRQQVRAATLRLAGVLDAVAFEHYDKPQQRIGKARWIRSPVQIVGGWGAVSERDAELDLALQLVVSRVGDNGIEVFGGIVASAAVLGCEYVIEAMDDVLLRRRVDRHSGLPGWSELIGADGGAPAPVRPAHDSALAPGGPASPPVTVRRSEAPSVASGTGDGDTSAAERWAAAAQLSAAARTDGGRRAPSATQAAAPWTGEEEPEEALDEEALEDYRPMRAGDFIEHTKFGRCVIERVDANEEFVTVRLRNHRLVRLNVDVLNLRYWHDEETRQVFGPRDQQ